MILQTSLAAALLAASPSSAPQDELLRLLPVESPLVFAVGDIAGLLAAEEPPAWVALFQDERVHAGLLAAAELDEDLGTEGASAAMRVLECVRAAGVGMLHEDSDAGVAVLRVTDGFLPALRDFCSSIDLELEEADVIGRRGYRAASEGSDALSMVEIDGIVILGLGHVDQIDDGVRAVVSALEDGPEEGGWWTAAAPRVESPLVEVFVRLEILDDDEEFTSMFPNADTAYAGVGVGEGHEGDISFTMNVGENDLFGLLAPAFGEADVELLKLAPPEAISAAVINLDFNFLIEAGLRLSEGEEMRQQFEEGLQAWRATLGVDLEEDIFGNLSGDILMVQWPGAELAFANDDPAALVNAAPVVLVRIEDSEPFYTLLETAETLLGPDVVEAEDTVGGSIWRTEAIPGVSVAAGLSETMLFFGTTEHVEEMMERAGGAPESGMLDEGQLAFAREALSGAYVAAVDLAQGWDLMMAALASEEEMAEFFELASEYLGGMAFGELRFGATEFGLRVVTR